MRSRRPLIGVTGPDRGHRISWFFLWLSLWLAGARMQRLTPKDPGYERTLDGVILSGGTDIYPERYGEAPSPDYLYDLPRDELECRWAKRALEEHIPVLGICRGAQMLNVCLGGSLYRDIKLVCETARHPDTVLSKIFARKPVALHDHGRLRALLGCEAVMVNSLHRQSINRLGTSLRITAQEENTIVQAIEGEAPHFLMGVQWHPEFMVHRRDQRAIFRALVDAARARNVLAD